MGYGPICCSNRISTPNQRCLLSITNLKGGNYMIKFFNSTAWNTLVLILLGILAFFTQELVTFSMLGFVLIMLSNIADKLDEISRKLDKN